MLKKCKCEINMVCWSTKDGVGTAFLSRAHRHYSQYLHPRVDNISDYHGDQLYNIRTKIIEYSALTHSECASFDNNIKARIWESWQFKQCDITKMWCTNRWVSWSSSQSKVGKKNYLHCSEYFEKHRTMNRKRTACTESLLWSVLHYHLVWQTDECFLPSAFL